MEKGGHKMFPIINSNNLIRNVGKPKKSENIADTAQKEQNYDQAEFSEILSQDEKNIKDLVAKVSNDVRVRPTQNRILELRNQVLDGTYKPNSSEIASKMMLKIEV